MLANHGRLGPLRAGLVWDAAVAAFSPDHLLRSVEPPVAGPLQYKILDMFLGQGRDLLRCLSSCLGRRPASSAAVVRQPGHRLGRGGSASRAAASPVQACEGCLAL